MPREHISLNLGTRILGITLSYVYSRYKCKHSIFVRIAGPIYLTIINNPNIAKIFVTCLELTQSVQSDQLSHCMHRTVKRLCITLVLKEINVVLDSLNYKELVINIRKIHIRKFRSLYI